MFNRIQLPEGYERHDLEYTFPTEDDDLRSYALKIGTGIEDHSVLVGLSLGGMMATEIAKVRPDLKVILLSSIPDKREFPARLSLLLKMKAHHVISPGFLKTFYTRVIGTYLKKHYDADAMVYFDRLMLTADTDMLKWFIESIKLWDNTTVPSNIIRIHGTHDEILPVYDKARINYLVKGGRHVMVMNRSEEISSIFSEILEKK